MGLRSQVLGPQYRIVQMPLETVRPFMYGQVALSSVDGLDPDDIKVTAALPPLPVCEVKVERMAVSPCCCLPTMAAQGTEAYLEERVNQMIAEASSSERSTLPNGEPMLPLIRLRASDPPSVLSHAAVRCCWHGF